MTFIRVIPPGDGERPLACGEWIRTTASSRSKIGKSYDALKGRGLKVVVIAGSNPAVPLLVNAI